MGILNDLPGKLEAKRKDLGMGKEILADRSNVSLSSVNRVLSGTSNNLEHIEAVAGALGVMLCAQDSTSAADMLRAQAHQKASELVDLVQGTSALEGQGFDESYRRLLMCQTEAELIRPKKKRRLWSS